MDNEKKPSRPLFPRLLLALIAVLITIGAIEFAARLTSGRDELSITNNLGSLKPSGNPVGDKLRRIAWDSSFTERGLAAPPGGPREGIWGEGVTPLLCATSDCAFRKSVPGVIEIDDMGFQTVGKKEAPYPHILIVGGSVAWGAGASDIDNTYFSRLLDMLREEYPDAGISVLAYYGSTSGTDLGAFVRRGLDVSPDVVVFLNGLNDLTVKGKVRHSDVSDYILNMNTARRIAEREGIQVMIIRQPFPGGKENKSEIEKRVMDLSNRDYDKVIVPHYNHIGDTLEKMSRTGEIYYIDAGQCFNRETATTFNDQWHFSDPGHELLARKIYAGLSPVLDEITAKKKEGAN